MIRTKTLTWPLVSAIFATATISAKADVAFEISTHKGYRQHRDSEIQFLGGDFDVFLRDGNGVVQGGCARGAYWPPNVPLDPCPGGSTAYVHFGDVNPETPNAGPYFWMTEVIPAIIIEPRRPDLCMLRAAPASKLARPTNPFKDSSYGVYYNLHETNVSEYVISRYEYSRTYGPKQLGKFEDEIVPGVYHYALPKLNQPEVKVAVSPVIYPMPEAFAKRNNVKSGVKFLVDSNKWRKNGYLELSYLRPNVIKWTGFSPSTVVSSVDNLYFSMRYISQPKNSRSPVTYTDPFTGENPASVFPGFVSGGDPRVLLANPYVTSFTLPPIFEGGTRAVIELELDRDFQTGGVTFDHSTRKFQLPVIILNRYKEYADIRFRSNTKKGTGILEDFDKDGYNNLNEWILDSRGDDSSSIPRAPVPVTHAAVVDAVPVQLQWFGFEVLKKRGTIPAVKYTLQRSKNGGKSWKTFNSDAQWTVTETNRTIRVESVVANGFDPQTGYPLYIQPPGTAAHLYRVKITLAK